MRRTDQFTLVVPPIDSNVVADARDSRRDVIRAFDSNIRACSPPGLDADGILSFMNRERAERTISREGKDVVEYNVRIRSYAERDKVHDEELSKLQLEYMIGPGGNGILLELLGHGHAATVLLKFRQIPYIEAYVPRMPDDPFLDSSYEFSQSQLDDTILDELKNHLQTRKGDPVAYVQILMNYYKKLYQKERGKNSGVTVIANPNAGKIDEDAIVRSLIDLELERADIVELADLVDADYEEAISNTFSNFRRARHYLLSPEKIKEYYDIIKSKFRYLHYAMAIFMSSKYYSINVALPEDEDDEMMSEDEEIHFKERLIVFLCLGMIRAKSRLLLRHYAIIEPFAYFSKGYQQPGRRTMTGGLNSTLPTSMKQLNKYTNVACLPSTTGWLGRCDVMGHLITINRFFPRKTLAIASLP